MDKVATEGVEHSTQKELVAMSYNYLYEYMERMSSDQELIDYADEMNVDVSEFL